MTGPRKHAHSHHGHDHDHDHDHGPRPGAVAHARAHDDHAHDDHGHDDHGHDDHGHDHDLSGTPARSLAIALALTASFLLVEVVVGWLAGSLALLSDAGHMLTDAGALALALVAQHLASRPRSARNTYGLRRAEILAAMLNGQVLGLSSIWIVVEAIERWSKPTEVKGGWVLVVAAIGLAMNLLSAWVLSRGAKNSNVKAALAHVLADAAGSVAAMVAGALVYLFGWTRADAAVSLLISLLILWGAWRLLRDSVHVLLEGSPAHLDADVMEKAIRQTPGVCDMHDLHLWSISDGFPVLTVHVVIDRDAHGVDVARAVQGRLRGLGVDHVTVQPEAQPSPQPLLPASALLARNRERRTSRD